MAHSLHSLLAIGVLICLSGCLSDSVPHPTHRLTVVNGLESGSYEEGTVVSVKAESPRSGLTFRTWSGDKELLNDTLSAHTEFLMPDRDVFLTALFDDTSHYQLEIIQGTGSGAYLGGSRVQVIADFPPDSMMFDSWMGDTILLDSPDSDSTWLTMPYSDAQIQAVYKPLPLYSLTVIGGSGSGEYLAGTEIRIEADPPAADSLFSHWEGGRAFLADSLSSGSTLQMPESDLEIRARYMPMPDLALTVIKGQGSGMFPFGSRTWILADPAAPGQQFIRWSGPIEHLESFDEDNAEVTMEKEMTFTALYRADTLARFSYHLDIVPIINEYCAACHSTGSNFSNLTNYQTLYQYRKDVRTFLLNGFMPPGGQMDEEDLQVLLTWINQGAQQN